METVAQQLKHQFCIVVAEVLWSLIMSLDAVAHGFCIPMSIAQQKLYHFIADA